MYLDLQDEVELPFTDSSPEEHSGIEMLREGNRASTCPCPHCLLCGAFEENKQWLWLHNVGEKQLLLSFYRQLLGSGDKATVSEKDLRWITMNPRKIEIHFFLRRGC